MERFAWDCSRASSSCLTLLESAFIFSCRNSVFARTNLRVWEEIDGCVSDMWIQRGLRQTYCLSQLLRNLFFVASDLDGKRLGLKYTFWTVM